MIDILKRMQAEDLEFENDSNEDDDNNENSTNLTDSDDEDDVPDLAERLQSVNLDDANRLWAALTSAEKQEFEATLRNGEVANFLPQWNPWWTESLEREVIQEIVDDKIEPEYVAKCPKIVAVPAFNELMKASPFVRFNILNVLYAYVYTVLHCNGDHQNSAKDSVNIFLQLCENMLVNKVYENSKTAIEAVSQKFMDCPSLGGNEEAMVATEQAVRHIINGPEKSNRIFYVLAALSDLHLLFTNAKKELSRQDQSKDRTFMKKFRISDTTPEVTKKMVLQCTKKIEYYLSWVKKYGISVDE
ncbi:zinc finger HIT domain-containing protein 2 isoform X2 [Venturia canescens]|nr:zinc finger HIT domain-containing protein 2 isoform X2 [Venturia canescens]